MRNYGVLAELPYLLTERIALERNKKEKEREKEKLFF